MPTCTYCGSHKASRANLKRHIKQSRKCWAAFVNDVQQFNIHTADIDSGDDFVSGSESESYSEEQNSKSVDALPEHWGLTASEELAGLPQQQRQPHIEEIVDEGDAPRTSGWNQGSDGSRFVESYPDHAGVPVKSGTSSTKFESILENEQEGRPWGVFETEGEWQLAKWLLQNVGHNQIANFLDLPIVRTPFDAGLHKH
jgi:hypothetical protein